MMGSSYIPSVPWALLFCFAPVFFWIAQKERTLKEAFWAGWVTQFSLSLIGFYWISYVSHEFGEIPWVAAILVLLIFASLVHLYIPLSFVLSRWLSQKLNLSRIEEIFLLALCYFIFECFWPSLFAWNMGYPWIWVQAPIYQLADLIGFQGLSLITLLMSSYVAYCFLSPQKKIFKLVLGAGFFLLLNVWGFFHAPQKDPQSERLKFLVVQANIGNSDRIQAEKGRGKQSEIVHRYIQATEEALEKYPEAELLMWPESAFPDVLNPAYSTKSRQKQLLQFLTKHNKPLLTGAYGQEEEATDKNPFNDAYNAIFLTGPQGLLDTPYYKTQLLAYGEYIPLTETFPILRKWFPELSSFGRGSGPQVMKYNQVQMGPQICYESLDPYFSAGLALKGANIIVNVTNDSWFGKHFEPYQNLYMTLARAIETRLPLVRATNTGLTTAILANGEILPISTLHEKWSGLFNVEYKTQPALTFYVRWGIYFPYVLGFLIFIFLGVKYARNQKS